MPEFPALKRPIVSFCLNLIFANDILSIFSFGLELVIDTL